MSLDDLETTEPCAQCGEPLHTGEGRVTVSFTVEELLQLACAAPSPRVRDRLLCAAQLLDADAVEAVRMEVLQ